MKNEMWLYQIQCHYSYRFEFKSKACKIYMCNSVLCNVFIVLEFLGDYFSLHLDFVPFSDLRSHPFSRCQNSKILGFISEVSPGLCQLLTSL